jgi:hypothetical protein
MMQAAVGLLVVGIIEGALIVGAFEGAIVLSAPVPASANVWEIQWVHKLDCWTWAWTQSMAVDMQEG